MSLLVGTGLMARLNDEDLHRCDQLMSDLANAQERFARRPKRPRVLRGKQGKERKPHTYYFVILSERADRPVEFQQFSQYATSAIRMDGTPEALMTFKLLQNIFILKGFTFGEAMRRGCNDGDVIIYSVEINGNEPEL